MTSLLVLVFGAWVASAPAGSATAPPVDNIVQEFSGTGSTTTAFFKVNSKWEVRWNARQAVSVAAMSSDGTIVAGASGVLRGSLFVPAGGEYYLKVGDGTASPAAKTAPAVNGAKTNAASAVPPSKEQKENVTWHLQVVQLPDVVDAADGLTVYKPYFTVPDAVITPTPAPPPPPTLTGEQRHALVTIKGDSARGNGFLVRSGEGVSVVTSLRLLAGNSNVVLTSASGTTIKTISARAAVDRDLAFLAVEDNHYSCLPLAPAGADLSPAEAVIIPVPGDPSAEAGKSGKILTVTADRLEIDSAVDAASLGAPIIRARDGAAVAIVAAEEQPDVSEIVAKAWPANPAPGSATILPFHGLRLSGIPGWEPLDLERFGSESRMLDQFHETTRCLDAYLNGRKHHSSGGVPEVHYFNNDAKIVAAQEMYKKVASGADNSQSLNCARELLSDLKGIADSGVSQLKPAAQSCSYNRRRAQEELAYRKAVGDELDSFADDIGKLNTLARTR